MRQSKARRDGREPEQARSSEAVWDQPQDGIEDDAARSTAGLPAQAGAGITQTGAAGGHHSSNRAGRPGSAQEAAAYGGTDIKPLSTAQLYQWVQPSNPDIGNPLFGLEGGNVLNSFFAYNGDYSTFGTPSDPMVGKRVGGTISFGGGLGLYKGTTRIGGLGLSGDTACADHSVAWRIRYARNLKPTAGDDRLPFATNATNTNGHPHCPNDANTQGAK